MEQRLRCVPSERDRRFTGADANVLLRRYAARRDARDLDALVRRFRPLARKLAFRYARGSETMEDLEQVASLGLVKALQRFEPDRGFAFTSFAVPTILGELKRSFRDTAWSVRVPRSVQERMADVRAASDADMAEHGRPPSARELAERLECDEELVVEAMHAAGALSAVSLDRVDTFDDEGGQTLSDRLGEGDAGFDLVDHRLAMETALPMLTATQREVIRLRFEEDLKQSEIADRLGCSQMQISRILRAGLQRLSVLADRAPAGT